MRPNRGVACSDAIAVRGYVVSEHREVVSVAFDGEHAAIREPTEEAGCRITYVCPAVDDEAGLEDVVQAHVCRPWPSSTGPLSIHDDFGYVGN